MGLFSKASPEGDITTVVPEIADEKGRTQNDPAAISEKPDLSSDVDRDAQDGVQKIEAAAQVWSKWTMVAAYVM
jgi:hypothetical protein